MHDLNTIADLNSRAVEASVPSILAKGKFAVAKYAGVNFIDVAEFDTVELAAAAAVEYEGQAPGNVAKVHSPKVEA